jgi:hypothetical protein
LGHLWLRDCGCGRQLASHHDAAVGEIHFLAELMLLPTRLQMAGVMNLVQMSRSLSWCLSMFFSS